MKGSRNASQCPAALQSFQGLQDNSLHSDDVQAAAMVTSKLLLSVARKQADSKGWLGFNFFHSCNQGALNPGHKSTWGEPAYLWWLCWVGSMDAMLGEVSLILQLSSVQNLETSLQSFFCLALDNGGCNKPAHIVCLSRSLSLQVCGIGLLLPPKKLIGNMDREFIAERQRGLQAYLDSVTQHPLLSSSLPVKKFLDPNSYSANYTGIFAPCRSMGTYGLSIY